MEKHSQLQKLRKKPRISHVNSWFNRPFIEWISGRVDGKRFQICDLEGGHITPYINRKSHFLDTYMNFIGMLQESLMKHINWFMPFVQN